MMEKLYVGIDLSLNSTGVTFLPQNGKTRYLSILNRWVFTSSPKKTYQQIIDDSMLLSQLRDIDNLFMVMIDRKPLTDVKKIGLSPWGRLHLRNCILYSNLIAEHIERIILDYYPGHQVHIGVEHYSLGSKDRGTNTMQLIEITSLLKARLIEKDMKRLEDFHLFPGPTVKLKAGAGNFDKYMMLRAYTSNATSPQDNLFEFISKNDFLCYTKKIKSKKQIIKANKKLGIERKVVTVQIPVNDVLSPVSDIIDSWWVAYCIKTA